MKQVKISCLTLAMTVCCIATSAFANSAYVFVKNGLNGSNPPSLEITQTRHMTVDGSSVIAPGAQRKVFLTDSHQSGWMEIITQGEKHENGKNIGMSISVKATDASGFLGFYKYSIGGDNNTYPGLCYHLWKGSWQQTNNAEFYPEIRYQSPKQGC